MLGLKLGSSGKEANALTAEPSLQPVGGVLLLFLVIVVQRQSHCVTQVGRGTWDNLELLP